MITTYNFSIRGRDHIKYDMPCHDYSLVRDISASWKLALVADGVGSCSHADIASKIAGDTAADLIIRQFPTAADDEAYIGVLMASMHGAANAVEAYVEDHDPGNERQYQTTLTVGVMSKSRLFYANAGDSGIVALDTDGIYHIVTRKQNDEEGAVYSVPAFRKFEIGKADFEPIALMCLTDGILDALTLSEQERRIMELEKIKYPVDVPFANLFLRPALGCEPGHDEADTQACRDNMIRYLESDECKALTDDLSAAVIMCTGTGITERDIPWEEPKLDPYKLKWEECQIYPSMKTAVQVFKKYIKAKNPEWSTEKVDDFALKYTDPQRETYGDGKTAEPASQKADTLKVK